MIYRITDPFIVNAFASHPDVLPQIGGVPIDFSGAMNPANVFLFGQHGGFIYEWKGPQTFEVHVMITRPGRGRWAFTAAQQSIDHMAGLGANHIWARIHPARPDVAMLALKTGFKDAGTHELDTGHGPVVWRIMNWRK